MIMRLSYLVAEFKSDNRFGNIKRVNGELVVTEGNMKNIKGEYKVNVIGHGHEDKRGVRRLGDKNGAQIAFVFGGRV
jgi:hypothetical protein